MSFLIKSAYKIKKIKNKKYHPYHPSVFTSATKTHYRELTQAISQRGKAAAM